MLQDLWLKMPVSKRNSPDRTTCCDVIGSYKLMDLSNGFIYFFQAQEPLEAVMFLMIPTTMKMMMMMITTKVKCRLGLSLVSPLEQ